MRLWSLHPKYLDPQGLVALWREALLAQAVLRGETRGYRSHPQLERFKRHAAPLAAISQYLQAVHAEAVARGYAFDRRKIQAGTEPVTLLVTSGQLDFEWAHLMNKLQTRNPVVYRQWHETVTPEPLPMFEVRSGQVESWERPHS
ncbi:pyrimidine dimer DNA glycosylase/endonuclease V [Paludibacterium purpuratum]|uniref:Pyrimidine dimer DNA glycosylase /DNA-(Apurinic or apyrimidinic site) lyase n=1 Tax=Paludibacterium purpuratum TaxID=1144873 RepID=A0A4V3DUT6_9NEIS|nr:pyrimidine dimer DNA glycosylase/endonuclease V [Paludibacterium purpuratum]TDR76457.1 hypothetical protein DFP86_11140 [Paludibacterium purpuratum]